MNNAYAEKWLRLLNEDAQAAVDLYADSFFFEDLPLEQEITDKEELLLAFLPFVITNPPGPGGTHKLELKQYIGDERMGLIKWIWKGQHTGDFLTIPAAGKETVVEGLTFHVYNQEGKIVHESTCGNMVGALQQLGVIGQLPHWWEIKKG